MPHPKSSRRTRSRARPCKPAPKPRRHPKPAPPSPPPPQPTLRERLGHLASAGVLARMTPDQVTRALGPMTEEDARAFEHDWLFWARDKQKPPPGDWRTWLILAGRGFGKTRTGAEMVRAWAESGQFELLTLAGATADDIRDAMVDGESGVLAISRPDFFPKYEPSKLRLTWPNGTRALLLSAAEPERFRGKQHMKVWADELAAWKHPEAWDMLLMGLRLGKSPQAVVTTTPRPTRLIKQLVADPTTVVTRGATWENRNNLAPQFLAQILRKYEGTRLGRQELEAEILDDTPGALWSLELFERCRVAAPPALLRKIIAVDPSVASDGGGDECGIIVAGVGECDCLVRAGKAQQPDLHAFVLEDLSGSLPPDAWATRVVRKFHTDGLDKCIAEVNNGGGLVETTLRAIKLEDGFEGTNVAYKAVQASQGKSARAEPVAAFYEQGRVHHVGALPRLEDECRTWNPLSGAKSPNRLDALVWAITELLVDGMPRKVVWDPEVIGESFWASPAERAWRAGRR